MKTKELPTDVDGALVEKLLTHATTESINLGAMHVSSAAESETARVDGSLMSDLDSIRGQALYLSSFFCRKNDWQLCDAIKADLAANFGTGTEVAPIDWSRHEVYENPSQLSPTFNAMCEAMDRYFDVEIYATRLNYYRNGDAWKPFHRDSHAYGGKALREDFTIGISLGHSRLLQFLHEASRKVFDFPQNNGDCFAFTSEVNNRFMHGVPKSGDPHCGDRFSVIVWGRRRKLNERNGGGAQIQKPLGTNETMGTVDDAIEAAYHLVRVNQKDSTTHTVSNAPAAKKVKKRLQ